MADFKKLAGLTPGGRLSEAQSARFLDYLVAGMRAEEEAFREYLARVRERLVALSEGEPDETTRRVLGASEESGSDVTLALFAAFLERTVRRKRIGAVRFAKFANRDEDTGLRATGPLLPGMMLPDEDPPTIKVTCCDCKKPIEIEKVRCGECSVLSGTMGRYQACVHRLLEMFGGDPLPEDHPAHSLIERLEAMIDLGLVGPSFEFGLESGRKLLDAIQGRLCTVETCINNGRTDLEEMDEQIRRNRENIARLEGRMGPPVGGETFRRVVERLDNHSKRLDRLEKNQ